MSRTSGVTLIEMIVVIIILAIALSLSVGLLMNAGKDLGVQASAHAAVTFLRNASQFARLQALPAWVNVDTKKKTLQAVTPEVFGTWHFEEKPPAGGDAVTFSVRDGGRVPGKLGMAVDLRGNTVVRCVSPKPTDRLQGLFVDLWVYPRRATGRKTLLRIGKNFEIAVEATGLVSVKLEPKRLVSRTALPSDAWTHLLFAYEPSGDARLYLNGDETAISSGRADLPKESEIQIGDAKAGFVGIVDELMFGQIVAREPLKLGGEARIEFAPDATLTDGVFRIAFTPDGTLDPRRHRGPVVFTLASSAESKEIRIERNGVVQRFSRK